MVSIFVRKRHGVVVCLWMDCEFRVAEAPLDFHWSSGQGNGVVVRCES